MISPVPYVTYSYVSLAGLPTARLIVMDFLVFISTGHCVLHPSMSYILSIYPSIYVCIYLSTNCLSICLSMCLATYQSDYLTCIHLFLLTCDLTMALGS